MFGQIGNHGLVASYGIIRHAPFRSFPMKDSSFLLALGFVAALAVPASAGILFGRHAKPSPAERVSQLLLTVRTDSSDSKRASAAKELREFDPNAFPEIVPVLIEVLKHDQKAAVRAEAAQTLGKLRPISQEAGTALEEATSDPSWRVRWQARPALRAYRSNGYRGPTMVEETAPATGQQSTSFAPPAPSVKRGFLSPAGKTGPTFVPNETPPPPLADPLPITPASKPVPKNISTPVPVEMPKLQRPPPAPAEEGPDLR
jgi:HEAT repeats